MHRYQRQQLHSYREKIAIRTNFQPLNLLIRFVLRHWVNQQHQEFTFMGRIPYPLYLYRLLW